MSAAGQEGLGLRTAFEALRAGVPNRAAVRLLGSVEDGIEEAFDAGLGQVWSKAPAPGLLVAGGFGAGKSHLLGYLREVAAQRNFIVSLVSVSKETPLSAPLEVFAAAMRNTLVPGHSDDVMTVVLAALQRRPEALEGLKALVSEPKAGLAPVFAAILHLLARPVAPDLLRRIETFLAGGKLPRTALREALKQAGADKQFDLGAAADGALAAQRERFTPLLFRVAGFAGWCLLFDELELIGRYSLLQRARAYAELGRWLGLGAGARVPGLYAAGAITDDFAEAVIRSREDDTKLPERLHLKGEPLQAELALAAIRAIEAAALLNPPAEADLRRHTETLRRSYSEAYGWAAPPLPVGERQASRTFRHHVRGWITQWDVLRLQGRTAGLELDTVAPNYEECAALEETGPSEEWRIDG